MVTHPLRSAAQWYAVMARAGITATSEMTYATKYQAGYEAMAALPSVPLRISLYHMSTEPDAGDRFESAVPDALLQKRGVKLWADGSPWVGNVALSYPYLDSDATRRAGIVLDTGGVAAMNYTRDELDAVIDAHAGAGWQLAFHVNGDLALDVVLDAYERGLKVHGLMGTDHRWRIEHCGAARREQFERGRLPRGGRVVGGRSSSSTGATCSTASSSPPTSAPTGCAGTTPSRPASAPRTTTTGRSPPPLPLLNIQTAVTPDDVVGHGPGAAADRGPR